MESYFHGDCIYGRLFPWRHNTYGIFVTETEYLSDYFRWLHTLEIIFMETSTLLRSGGNYHHSMFHNPTAAVNLFHVGKQYLTFCKAEAAVTHNLIGRKIISNVKHPDARNSLPILDVIRSSHKRCSASGYCKWTLRQTTGVCYTRIYVVGAPSHFPTEYRHETAVVNREHIGWNEWLYWEIVINDHCHGSVGDIMLRRLFSHIAYTWEVIFMR